MSSIWHAALCCHWHPVKSVHTTLSRCRVMASDVILEMSPSSRRVRPRCMQGRGRYGGLGGMCRLTACFPCHGYHTSSHGCQWEQWKPLWGPQQLGTHRSACCQHGPNAWHVGAVALMGSVLSRKLCASAPIAPTRWEGSEEGSRMA